MSWKFSQLSQHINTQALYYPIKFKQELESRNSKLKSKLALRAFHTSDFWARKTNSEDTDAFLSNTWTQHNIITPQHLRLFKTKSHNDWHTVNKKKKQNTFSTQTIRKKINTFPLHFKSLKHFDLTFSRSSPYGRFYALIIFIFTLSTTEFFISGFCCKYRSVTPKYSESSRAFMSWYLHKPRTVPFTC